MNEILMTNIFFAITGVATIIITIVMVILLIFIIKLVRKVNSISESVQEETVKIIADVEDARLSVKENIHTFKKFGAGIVVSKLIEKIFKR
ncbi:hypothetical protein CL684_01485 [Candidatus Campbellbacteria bacterium]|nr:hypothetical protein [Candidatus Campbellbacteria bacterium]|tara:strand:+ start:287 stop:559 length:273 start_codon:yes stop_codon:yes gene_type:complete